MFAQLTKHNKSTDDNAKWNVIHQWKMSDLRRTQNLECTVSYPSNRKDEWRFWSKIARLISSREKELFWVTSLRSDTTELVTDTFIEDDTTDQRPPVQWGSIAQNTKIVSTRSVRRRTIERNVKIQSQTLRFLWQKEHLKSISSRCFKYQFRIEQNSKFWETYVRG